MSAFIRCAGLVAGVSAVAVLGVAIAQSDPVNPLVGNAAIGAGQQSTHLTPMGETGVQVRAPEARREVAVVPAPVPAPVAAARFPPRNSLRPRSQWALHLRLSRLPPWFAPTGTEPG